MIVHTDESGSTNLGTAIDLGSRMAGDEIIIDGDLSYQSGLNISTLQFARVECRELVTVGGAGTSMTIDVSGASGLFVMRSANPVYVAAGGSGGEIQTAQIYSAPRGVWFTGGTVPLAEQLAGVSTFTDGVDLQVLNISGGQATIQTHATHTVDTIRAYGAQVIVRRSIAVLAEIYPLARLETDNRDITVAAVELFGSWRINNGEVTGNVTLYPGSSLDFSAMEGDVEFSGNLTVWPGVSITGDVPVGLEATFTGTVTLVAGGSIGPWST